MDPLQDLTNLEEQYYAEGYALGHHDGEQAGRREGRQFGMEKGFEKFSELGRLSGWSAVLVAQQKAAKGVQTSERTQKHLAKIVELTDIANISTDNSEDGVADTDERIRDVQSKEVMITKIMGTGRGKMSGKAPSSELEDFGGLGRRAPTT